MTISSDSIRLHPRLAGVAGYLDDRRAELMALVAGHSDERLARKPPTGWSVAQILDHLQRTERSIILRLAPELAVGWERGMHAELDETPVLGMLDRFNIRDRTRFVAAPKPVEPADAPLASEAIAQLVRARGRLKDVIAKGNGLALGRLVIPHPRFGELDFYGWLLFVGQHEARHTAQARDVLAATEAA
jgi:hypothetical protein